MLRLKLTSKVTKKINNGLLHLPDFLIYDFDEAEYQTFWRELINHPKKQLYSDGLQIYKVSWIRSVFESFKGWLGFENPCQSNNVELTLAKIAYCGYIKGYHPHEFSKFTKPPLISSGFTTLINSERNSSNSNKIQHVLMTYYLTHSEFIPQVNPLIKKSYPFGSVLINIAAELIPSLDPQDKEVISHAINYIYTNNISSDTIDNLESSSFAEAYAEFLVNKDQLVEALKWSTQITSQYKEQFIELYLSQENSSREFALTKALELINALFLSVDSENQNKAINFLKNITFEEQLHYLKTYPDLSKKLAKYYLNQASIEKNKYSLTKLFTGNHLIPYLAQAFNLDPMICNKDSDIQDIMMQQEWITYLFDAAIKEKHLQKARSLFESHPDFKFNSKSLDQLQDDYDKEFNDNVTLIKLALENKETEKAEKLGRQTIALARIIAKINPSDNPLLSANINYIKILLKVDKIEHPDVKNADLGQLNKALLLLNKFYKSNKLTKPLYNELILRIVNRLIEEIKVPYGFDKFSGEERCLFIKNKRESIDTLKNKLNTYLNFNKENITKEIKPALAKMYFILADITLYFDSNKEDAMRHFKKATEIMPENPYYSLCYHELADDQYYSAAKEKVEQIGSWQIYKWNAWKRERWMTDIDQIETRDMHIHEVFPEAKGLLSRFFN